MKIGIPVFKGRVSPTFDFCRHMLLVEVSSGKWSEINTVTIPEAGHGDRAVFVRELGVDLLLCGGISLDLSKEIEAAGISVVPWLSGEIPEVLDACLTGRFTDPGSPSQGFKEGESDAAAGRENFFGGEEGGESACHKVIGIWKSLFRSAGWRFRRKPR